MDLMPTLLEITGAALTDPIKQQLEGRRLVPLMVQVQNIGNTFGPE